VLLSFDKDLKTARCTLEKRGENALACIFISKDRICSLDSNTRELLVSSFDGTNSRKWPIMKKGLTKIDMIFPAPLGKILVAADDSLFMYDLSAKRVIYELSVSDVRRVQWNPQFTHCVVITKTSIFVLDRTLSVINQQKETSKIKSGCFDEQNSFVYSTSTHIKYMFLEGKTSGTFKSIEEPVYVAFVSVILSSSYSLSCVATVHEEHLLRPHAPRRDGDLHSRQHRLSLQASSLTKEPC